MDALIVPILRFFHYALLMGVFGLTAFRLIGLKPEVAAHMPDTHGWRAPALMAAPILSCALMLMQMAQMMGLPLVQLDWSIVDVLATQTPMGWAFLLRLLSLVLAGLVLLIWPLRTKTLWAVAGLYAVALASLAWSGHAAATQGHLGLIHRANDALHLWTTSLWMGAIGTFLSLAVRAYRTPEKLPPQVLGAALRAFTPLGVALVMLSFATGLVNADMIFGLTHIGQILAEPYGQLLLLKLVLVGAMLGCAVFHAGSVRRSAQSSAQPAELRASLSLEFGLLLAILALVAWLGTIMPMAS